MANGEILRPVQFEQHTAQMADAAFVGKLLTDDNEADSFFEQLEKEAATLGTPDAKERVARIKEEFEALRAGVEVETAQAAPGNVVSFADAAQRIQDRKEQLEEVIRVAQDTVTLDENEIDDIRKRLTTGEISLDEAQTAVIALEPINIEEVNDPAPTSPTPPPVPSTPTQTEAKQESKATPEQKNVGDIKRTALRNKRLCQKWGIDEKTLIADLHSDTFINFEAQIAAAQQDGNTVLAEQLIDDLASSVEIDTNSIRKAVEEIFAEKKQRIDAIDAEAARSRAETEKIAQELKATKEQTADLNTQAERDEAKAEKIRKELFATPFEQMYEEIPDFTRGNNGLTEKELKTKDKQTLVDESFENQKKLKAAQKQLTEIKTKLDSLGFFKKFGQEGRTLKAQIAQLEREIAILSQKQAEIEAEYVAFVERTKPQTKLPEVNEDEYTNIQNTVKKKTRWHRLRSAAVAGLAVAGSLIGSIAPGLFGGEKPAAPEQPKPAPTKSGDDIAGGEQTVDPGVEALVDLHEARKHQGTLAAAGMDADPDVQQYIEGLTDAQGVIDTDFAAAANKQMEEDFDPDTEYGFYDEKDGVNADYSVKGPDRSRYMAERRRRIEAAQTRRLMETVADAKAATQNGEGSNLGAALEGTKAQQGTPEDKAAPIDGPDAGKTESIEVASVKGTDDIAVDTGEKRRATVKPTRRRKVIDLGEMTFVVDALGQEVDESNGYVDGNGYELRSFGTRNNKEYQYRAAGGEWQTIVPGDAANDGEISMADVEQRRAEDDARPKAAPRVKRKRMTEDQKLAAEARAESLRTIEDRGFNAKELRDTIEIQIAHCDAHGIDVPTALRTYDEDRYGNNLAFLQGRLADLKALFAQGLKKGN